MHGGVPPCDPRERQNMATQETQDSRAIDPAVRIGHVHLKVADLQRAVNFYQGVLGFEVMQRWGTQAAFLSAGGYHHHIGLNTWESAGGRPPARGTTGLYHVGVLYSTRAALADAVGGLMAGGVGVDGGAGYGGRGGRFFW